MLKYIDINQENVIIALILHFDPNHVVRIALDFLKESAKVQDECLRTNDFSKRVQSTGKRYAISTEGAQKPCHSYENRNIYFKIDPSYGFPDQARNDGWLNAIKLRKT